MNIFVFGNGNLSFTNFLKHYIEPIQSLQNLPAVHFMVCDFRGTDTLMLEFLKTLTPHVSVYHMGEKPRYMPDIFKTRVGEWQFVGGFQSDKERDVAAILKCTHFLGIDFNTDKKRKSGTSKNIDLCLEQGKINLLAITYPT